MFFINLCIHKTMMFFLKIAVKLIEQPQPIIFSGVGSSRQLAQFIADQGNKKVLIVTDNVLNKLGIANAITEVLERHNIEFVTFDQVTPDPSDLVIEQGVQCAKQHQCEVILGVGGGSSLDAAKMIAVLCRNNKSVSDVAGLLKIKHQSLPLFLVPTTSGTGSEVTMAAVITDHDSENKSLVISPKMMAMATALDPVLMQGMPAKITADTGFDALTHAIEAYLSLQAQEQTDSYATAAVKLIFKHLPAAYNDGNNLAARQSLAMASCYAGLAFTKAGLGYVHAISHQLGAKYHLPHGMTNAVVLPYVLEFSAPASFNRLADLAIVIGIESQGKTAQQLASDFIQRVKDLQQVLNIASSLPQVARQDITSLAQAALKEAHYLYPVPKYMSLPQCEQLIGQLIAPAITTPCAIKQ